MLLLGKGGLMMWKLKYSYRQCSSDRKRDISIPKYQAKLALSFLLDFEFMMRDFYEGDPFDRLTVVQSSMYGPHWK